MESPPQNLSQLLQKATLSDNNLLIYPRGRMSGPCVTISYDELLSRARERAQCLCAFFPSARRQVVLLHFDDHLTALEWFWAAVVAGFLPVMSPTLAQDLAQRRTHLLHLNQTLKRPIILTSSHLIPEFLDMRELRFYEVEALRDGYQPDSRHTFPGSIATREDIAVLMLTSGSSGLSKAVCLRHGQIITAVEGKSQFHSTTEATTFFNWVGLDHVANLTEIHLQAMYLGATQVHVHADDLMVNPRMFLKLLSKHQVGYTFAPNFFLAVLRRLLDEERASGVTNPEKLDLSQLKAFIAGAEAIVVETCAGLTNLLRDYGVEGDILRPGFGMTELCAGAIYGVSCPSYDLKMRFEFASLGVCIPGVSMRVITDNGKVASLGETGDVQTSGAIVFEEYYNNPKATDEVFTEDGWFVTGDRGFLDSNGELSLTGRVKENIIINGMKYSPHQLEAALEDAHIAGMKPTFTAVFAHRPQGSQSEQTCVVYVPAFNNADSLARTQTSDEIAKVLLLTCGVRPYQIIPLEQSHLQKTSLGKLSRNKIRAAFENGTYRPLQEENTAAIKAHRMSKHEDQVQTPMEEILLSAAKEAFGESADDIEVSSNLFELGITSIEILRLTRLLQTRLNVPTVPLIIVMANPGIRAMAGVLQKIMDAGGNKTEEYDPVVVLNAHGSRTPLWLIHPGVGEVLVFLNLAKFIPDRPVYALRARGFSENEQFFEDIPEITSIYLLHIKQKQPQGPYAIAGYSFGAMLAFEITKCLEAQSDEVKFLGCFDLPPHIKSRMRQLDWIEVALDLGCFLDLYSEDQVRELSPAMHLKTKEDVIQELMAMAPPNKLEELSLSREKLERWISLAYAIQHAAQDYEPSGSVASIDVFYGEVPPPSVSDGAYEWFCGQLSRWRDYSRSDPRVHRVTGRHYTILNAEHAFSFSKRLQAALVARGL